MDKIKFSIIIPTYNSSKTIKKCLESLVEQNLKNFEILIIDGISTDKTLEIACSFNDSRIAIYSETDQGIYDAMNKGIKLAKGEWLYFLGSDDELYNNGVLQSIEPYLQPEIPVFYGNVLMANTGMRYCGKVTDIEIFFKNICQQAIFYNKNVFKLLKFNLKYRVFADHDLNIKLFKKDYKNIRYEPILIAKYANDGFSSRESDCFNEDLFHIKSSFYSKGSFILKLKYAIYNQQLRLKPTVFRGLLMRIFRLLS
jgi:glycosyltransferase involved in cell wall biosynthesis